MNRKLLICPWFGELPDWWDKYEAQLPELAHMGYDMLIDHDLDTFKDRVRDLLDIDPPVFAGGSKVHDFRACLGLLYQAEVEEYEWWGHTDFDCVYGNLNRFVDDSVLAHVDAYSQCAYDYLSGPFTLYRNTEATERLFEKTPAWRETLTSPATTGWVETTFTQAAKQNVRVLIEDHHAFGDPAPLARKDDRLLYDGREITFFHFNRTKRWPL